LTRFLSFAFVFLVVFLFFLFVAVCCLIKVYIVYLIQFDWKPKNVLIMFRFLLFEWGRLKNEMNVCRVH